MGFNSVFKGLTVTVRPLLLSLGQNPEAPAFGTKNEARPIVLILFC